MHENDPIIQPGKRPVPLPLKIFAIALMALSALTLPLATTTLAVCSVISSSMNMILSISSLE